MATISDIPDANMFYSSLGGRYTNSPPPASVGFSYWRVSTEQMALHINPINNFLLMGTPWVQVFFFPSLSLLRRLLYHLLTFPRHSGRAEIRGHSMSAEKVKWWVGGFVFVAFIIERMCMLTFSDITLIGAWDHTDKGQNSTLDFKKRAVEVILELVCSIFPPLCNVLSAIWNTEGRKNIPSHLKSG